MTTKKRELNDNSCVARAPSPANRITLTQPATVPPTLALACLTTM